ncbi:MAG: class I SAM-dependent methyltransferase [Candidatus Shapirobacteria bacterium]|jgi:SAM-dependent methyltransferase
MDYQEEYIHKHPSLHLEQAQLKAKQILDFLGPIKINSLLDIGCGSGGITEILKDYLKPTKVVGVDISQTMILAARERDKMKRIEWICEDILTYHSKTRFDLVVGVDILEHISDDVELLKIIHRLGKKVLIKVPMEDSFLDNQVIRKLGISDSWKESERKYGHIHHYNERQLLEIYKGAGFRIIKSGYIPLPRRSKMLYEVLRVLFLPLGWFSKKAVANFVGGFKIVLMEPSK